MTQTTLIKYLEKIESEQIPPHKWKLTPKLINEGVQKQEIDTTTALYLLKTLPNQVR